MPMPYNTESERILPSRKSRKPTYKACHACLQLEEVKQVKDSSSQDILERLSSARSEASSLSEQLASAKRQAEAEHKENLKLQKVTAHCAHLPAGYSTSVKHV